MVLGALKAKHFTESTSLFFCDLQMQSSLVMPIRQEQMVFYSIVNHPTFMEENPGKAYLKYEKCKPKEKM